MNEHKIAKRYAQALFQHLSSLRLNEDVYSDSKTLIDILNDSSINNFLISPINSRKEKQKMISFIATKYNFHSKFTIFLNFICEKGRVDILTKVLHEYIQLFQINNGIRDAVLESAFTLDQENINTIKVKLENKTKLKLLITEQINENLVGGFRLNIDQEIYDYSVINQIEKLKKQFIAGN